VLALPCWLLGCWLGDWQASGRTTGIEKWLWPLRVATWAGMVICSVLRYHTPIGYPWTLNLFAILATVWLAAEIRHFSKVRPVASLEWAGQWSYSLYLTHKLCVIVLEPLNLEALGFIVGWSVRAGLMLVGAYVFYLVLEKPSHQVARRVGQWFFERRLQAVSHP
jgi:peptidoglycan/LPS O-acetylase OafA/YrhL